MVKISVIVLAYNQRDIISKTLDSILCQKDYLYEVLIGDDCSTDGTREVLKKYEAKYPNLVKPILNEKNLGIYGNKENLIANVTGDLMLSIGGDDLYYDGYFKRLTEFVEERNLDCQNDAFVIYCNHRRDYADSRPNRIVSCKAVETDKSPRSLYIRKGVPTHGKAVSYGLVKKLKPIPKNIGICADTLSCHQDVYLSDKVYSCDYIGIVYNAGIGVSVTEKKVKRLESHNKALTILRDDYSWNKKDCNYINYQIAVNNYWLAPSCKKWYICSSYFFKSLYLSNLTYMKLSLFDYGKFVVRSLRKMLSFK